MRFDVLLQEFGSVDRAYSATQKELEDVIGSFTTTTFVNFRETFDPQKKLEEFEKKGIRVLTREDKSFPKNLLKISDPPICLYVKGNVEVFDFEKDFFIAVVGTRRPTSYGQHIAEKFAFELSQAGFVVVSGLAMGIDSVAHKAALGAGGRTIAFLGCGVDIIHPPSNRMLYEAILQKDGLIISEFPPGQTVRKGLFVARNRLISGLSKGVLVIEGAADSGALITARYAAEQGREVFAAPGPITSEMSAAPIILLKQGAKLVTDVSDILEEFHLRISPVVKKDVVRGLEGEERRVVEALIQEPKLADEIAVESKIPINSVLQVLSALEIKGIIEKNTEGKYQPR